MYKGLEFLFDFVEKYYSRGEESINAFVINRECNDFKDLMNFIQDASKGILFWGPYTAFELELNYDTFHILFEIYQADQVAVSGISRNNPALVFSDKKILNVILQIQNFHNANNEIPLPDFSEILEELLESPYEFSCTINFNLRKSNTVKEILENSPWISSLGVFVFFKKNKMVDLLKSISPGGLQEDLFDKERVLIFVIGDVKYVYGDYIGIFGLQHIDEFQDKLEHFLETRKEPLRDKLEFLSRVSFIDRIDTVTPPDCFQAETHFDLNDKDIFYDIFASFSIIFTLIYFSSNITFDGKSCWTLAIHGDRIIKSTVFYEKKHHEVKILYDSEEKSVPDPTRTAIDLFEIYEWIFAERNIERVFLSRKMTLINTKNFYEITQNYQEIFKAITTNWNFYLDRSIDKFIDFRQNFTDYLFNHNQELIKFHSKLSSDMSDTAFKIFGYLLVFLLGWQEKASETQFELHYIVLGLSFLCAYLLFSLKRFRKIGETYSYFDTQHKKHLNYYKKLIDIHDFEEDRIEENRKFYSEYGFYLSLLYIFLLSTGLSVLYIALRTFLELPLTWVLAIIAAVIIASSLLFQKKRLKRPNLWDKG